MKILISCLYLLVCCILSVPTVNAELLGSISDETAPLTDPTQTKAAKQNDRKIIYRVICSAEDKDLPDCDQSAVDDGNDPAPTVTLPMPDLPPDPEDAVETPEHSVPVKPSKAEAQQKSFAKKAGADKKSAKKSASKKSSAKKPAGKKASRK